jgi:hypothetical protein
MRQHPRIVNPFEVKKTQDWGDLPMYKKIAYYSTQLHEKYAPYVDKLKAKEIVKSILGDKIKVAKVVRVLTSPDDIHDTDINPDHILKSAHASRWNIDLRNVKNGVDKIKEYLQRWNKTYSTKELQYTFLTPQFYIEEKIVDQLLKRRDMAIVYMVRCVRGRACSVGVQYGSKQNIYNLNWYPLDKPQIDGSFLIPQPKRLPEMLEMANTLAQPFEFVRIDFYIDVNEDIYFSEFTFTPASGNQVFSLELEHKMGMMWL